MRLLVRFCVELIDNNVLESDSYLELLERIVEQCDPSKNGKMGTEVAASGACVARSELFLSVILDTLPFIGKKLCQVSKVRFNSILTTLDDIFRAREEQLSVSARKMLTTFNQGQEVATNQAQDKWNQLVSDITPNGEGNWAETSDSSWEIFDKLLIRPNRSIFEVELNRAKPLQLSTINIPDHVCSLPCGVLGLIVG
jgi:hypothetical protein